MRGVVACLLALALTAASRGNTLAYWRFEEGTNGMRAPLYWSSGNYKWYQDASGNGNRAATYNWQTSPAYTNRVRRWWCRSWG